MSRSFRPYAILVLLTALVVGQDAPPAPQLNTQTHWYGNTWGGGPGVRAPYLQQTIDDIAVADGRIYAIAVWDERGGEASIYTTAGERVTVPEERGDWNAQFHSWGFSGGPAVALSDRHIFYSMAQNGEGTGKLRYAGVARYARDGSAAPFPGAVHGHRLRITDDHHARPRGLAVRGDELFVADPAGRRIAVFATANLAHRRDLPVADAGRLAVERNGAALWAIIGARAVRLDPQDGRELTAIADLERPAALAIDPRTGDLLVADNGLQRVHVRRYAAGSWRHVGRPFGGPLWAGTQPGAVGPARFAHITGLACDGSGALYVAEDALGARLHRFTANGREDWVRYGVEFVTCADEDPGDPGALYSRGFRYAINPAQPPGRSWRPVAYTLDPKRYPDDPRLHGYANIAVRMFRIDGQRIMMGRHQMSAEVWFWRFVGDIAVPAAAWFPAGDKHRNPWPATRPDGASIWSDADGNGRLDAEEFRSVPAAWFNGQSAHVDPALGLWCTTGAWEVGTGAIQRIPCAGLNAHGAPTWDPTAAASQPIPAAGGLRRVAKLAYDPAGDRLYIGGWTDRNPWKGGGWEQMNTGPELLRFDRWSTGPELAWQRVIIPPEGIIVGSVPKAWSFERDHAFIASTWKREQLAVDVWQLDDGKRVGRLLPTPCIGGVTGWIDMNDGVQSNRRPDGSYLICAEEVWMAKGLFWLWRP